VFLFYILIGSSKRSRATKKKADVGEAETGKCEADGTGRGAAVAVVMEATEWAAAKAEATRGGTKDSRKVKVKVSKKVKVSRKVKDSRKVKVNRKVKDNSRTGAGKMAP
jgi:hypothetical protein